LSRHAGDHRVDALWCFSTASSFNTSNDAGTCVAFVSAIVLSDRDERETISDEEMERVDQVMTSIGAWTETLPRRRGGLRAR